MTARVVRRDATHHIETPHSAVGLDLDMQRTLGRIRSENRSKAASEDSIQAALIIRLPYCQVSDNDVLAAYKTYEVRGRTWKNCPSIDASKSSLLWGIQIFFGRRMICGVAFGSQHDIRSDVRDWDAEPYSSAASLGGAVEGAGFLDAEEEDSRD